MVKILTSISIPLKLFTEIDNKRGNIPRSKFCLKLIEAGWLHFEEQK